VIKITLLDRGATHPVTEGNHPIAWDFDRLTAHGVWFLSCGTRQKSGLATDEYGNSTDLASAPQQQRVITM
jgi:hypothetical protein